MSKNILIIVLVLFVLQVTGYHFFSRPLLIDKVLKDQEFALISFPDSVFISFCNYGEEYSAYTDNYDDLGSSYKYEEELEGDTSKVIVDTEITNVLIEEDYIEEPPPHRFKYSEIPLLSTKEQLTVDQHFRKKFSYVKFAANEGDYLNSGVSFYVVYYLCCDRNLFLGRVEEYLQGFAQDEGYGEGWNSTYVWLLFTWVKIDRHMTGIS